MSQISSFSKTNSQKQFLSRLKNNKSLKNYFHNLNQLKKVDFNIHLAIFREPFLEYILEGKKTIETRFSMNRCAPYKKVKAGDLIFLKKSGGPVVGICRVNTTWDYILTPESWKEIKVEYAKAICAENPEFWEKRKSANFATLIMIDSVKEIEPIDYKKRDRRGWVVLSEIRNQLSFTY